MSDYSQEEIRLLDEFAYGIAAETSSDQRFEGKNAEAAANAYDLAAAMIAERRKRIGKQLVTYRGIPVMEANPLSEPVAQPEPEKGELTEEAIIHWRALAGMQCATMETRLVDVEHLDRAVALMREGLRYKEEAANWHNLRPVARACEAECVQLRARAEKAEEKVQDLLKNVADTQAQVNHAADLAMQNAKLADEQTEACRAVRKERDEARAELQRERMRLAACGVLAGCNTEDSLAKNLAMHPDYMSSSAQCVADAMRREIALRARAERAERAEAAFRAFIEEIVRFNNHDSWHHSQGSRTLVAHPAPKAEGGAS